MPDISLKITRQSDNQFVVEHNSGSMEKLGSDPSVARTQLFQAIDRFLTSVEVQPVIQPAPAPIVREPEPKAPSPPPVPPKQAQHTAKAHR